MEGDHPLKKHGKSTHKKRKKEQDFGIFFELCLIFTTAGPPFAWDSCRRTRHRNQTGMMECAMKKSLSQSDLRNKSGNVRMNFSRQETA